MCSLAAVLLIRASAFRKLLAHQMLRRRRAEALLRKEKGLDDEPDAEEGPGAARRGAAQRSAGALDSVVEEEAVDARTQQAMEMLKLLPDEKKDKFLNGPSPAQMGY